MKRYLLVISFLLFYYCGNDPTGSPSIDYYIDDQQFLDDLIDVNEIDIETIADRMTTVVFDSNTSYYKIKKLNLSNTGLVHLPSSIGNLDSLDKIDLSNNQLTTIPHTICNLTLIADSVKLNENQLCVRGPECIDIDYELQVCNYQYNLDDEQFIEIMISENRAENQGWFGLSSDSLYEEYSQPPLTLWEPKFKEDEVDSLELRIVEIDWNHVSDNDIPFTILPETISNLTELIYIDVAGNNLTNLPTSIKDLSNLEDLIIYSNLLPAIPSGIGNLQKLEVLEVYKNELTELPSEIGNLTSLLELRLQHNLLNDLPSELCAIMSQLTSFNVGCNDLIEDELDECFEGQLDDQGDDLNCIIDP